MRVTAETKAATEQTIRSAALRLFSRHGVDATGARAIAKDAGIAVGTLFNYFPSKEALAARLVADQLDSTPNPNPPSGSSLEAELFSLIAADIRALRPIRSFVAEVLELGFSPFDHTQRDSGQFHSLAEIRAQKLFDASAVLVRYGHHASVGASLMHLYWALYLAVLSFWCADKSPNQEDTWALLDHSTRMFVAGLSAKSPSAASHALEYSKESNS